MALGLEVILCGPGVRGYIMWPWGWRLNSVELGLEVISCGPGVGGYIILQELSTNPIW